MNVAKGWGSSCLPGGVEFDVTHAGRGRRRQEVAQHHHRASGRRARRDIYGWKKFKNNPSLVIEYNSLPSVPVAADAWSDPGGACVSGDGAAGHRRRDAEAVGQAA